MISKGVIIAIVLGFLEIIALFILVFKVEKEWKGRLLTLFSLISLAGLTIFLCLPYARKDVFLSIVLYDIVFIFTLFFYLIIYLLVDTIEFAAHATAAKKSAKDRKELIERLEREGRHDLVYNLRTAEWNEHMRKQKTN